MREQVPRQELMTRLNARETGAFEELFHAYYAPLCFFATKIVKDTEAARDVVQEVFIHFWEKELSFENMIALKSCLYISVQNKALNYIQKQNIRKRIQERLAMEERAEEDLFLRQVEADLLNALFAAIEELPPQCREVFTLSYIEQKDIGEVARYLDIAETTVKTQRRRAKAFLRKRLQHQGLWLLLLFLGEA